MNDEPQGQGAFAKRIKALSEGNARLRQAIVVIANDLSQTGALTVGAQARLARILGDATESEGT